MTHGFKWDKWTTGTGGAEEAFLSPFQCSDSLNAKPTAHAVGYWLPVLRT